MACEKGAHGQRTLQVCQEGGGHSLSVPIAIEAFGSEAITLFKELDQWTKFEFGDPRFPFCNTKSCYGEGTLRQYLVPSQFDCFDSSTAHCFVYGYLKTL